MAQTITIDSSPAIAIDWAIQRGDTLGLRLAFTEAGQPASPQVMATLRASAWRLSFAGAGSVDSHTWDGDTLVIVVPSAITARLTRPLRGDLQQNTGSGVLTLASITGTLSADVSPAGALPAAETPVRAHELAVDLITRTVAGQVSVVQGGRGVGVRAARRAGQDLVLALDDGRELAPVALPGLTDEGAAEVLASVADARAELDGALERVAALEASPPEVTQAELDAALARVAALESEPEPDLSPYALGTSVDALAVQVAGKASRADVAAELAALVDGAPATLDTLRELAQQAQETDSALGGLIAVVGGKAAAADLDAAEARVAALEADLPTRATGAALAGVEGRVSALESGGGEAGRGVASALVDGAGDLIVTYTDGGTSNAGHVVGTGGRGIAGAEVNSVGHLLIRYTDGSAADVGLVQGGGSAEVYLSSQGEPSYGSDVASDQPGSRPWMGPVIVGPASAALVRVPLRGVLADDTLRLAICEMVPGETAYYRDVTPRQIVDLPIVAGQTEALFDGPFEVADGQVRVFYVGAMSGNRVLHGEALGYDGLETAYESVTPVLGQPVTVAVSSDRRASIVLEGEYHAQNVHGPLNESDLPGFLAAPEGAFLARRDGLATWTTEVLRGITVSDLGAVQTTAEGALRVLPGARPASAVDLQTSRTSASQIASGDGALLAGGSGNTASGLSSVVLGGANGRALGDYSSVVGAPTSGNAARYGTIVGGQSHVLQAAATAGAIVGGESINSSGLGSAALGGNLIAISSTGTHGATLGGLGNALTAPYAVVSGQRAIADRPESHTIGAGGGLTSRGAFQAHALTRGIQTTDATPKLLEGGIALTARGAISLALTLTAASIGAAEVAAWTGRLVARRRTDGTVEMLVGTVALDHATPGAASWAAAWVLDAAAQRVDLQVVGAAGTTIRWAAALQGSEVRIF